MYSSSPESESTDRISLEDQEDDDPNDETLVTSSASTPSDPDREFIPRTPDKVSGLSADESFVPWEKRVLVLCCAFATDCSEWTGWGCYWCAWFTAFIVKVEGGGEEICVRKWWCTRVRGKDMVGVRWTDITWVWSVGLVMIISSLCMCCWCSLSWPVLFYPKKHAPGVLMKLNGGHFNTIATPPPSRKCLFI